MFLRLSRRGANTEAVAVRADPGAAPDDDRQVTADRSCVGLPRRYFHDLGDQSIKKLDEHVRAYSVTLHTGATVPAADMRGLTGQKLWLATRK